MENFFNSLGDLLKNNTPKEICDAIGENISARNAKGSTPLHIAARVAGKPEIIKALIAAGADINARNKKEQTPLHYAARIKNDETVAALANAGADANLEGKYGETPVQIYGYPI